MLTIHNTETEAAVRELARRLNISYADAVKIATEEALRRRAEIPASEEELLQIAARIRSKLDPAVRFCEDDLYDENGLPV